MLLRNKDRESLIAIFEEGQLTGEVWAYGSRVNGRAHPGSDLDLVVRTPDLRPLSSGTLRLLREKIRESNIPILVELHDWALLPTRFHDSIINLHEVLYKAGFSEINEPTSGYSQD